MVDRAEQRVGELPSREASMRLSSENPLRADYWFGRVDPRPQALFRITLGLTIIHDLVNYARDLNAFASDEGMLPRSVAGGARIWSLFNLTGNPFALGALFAAGGCIIVAFTLGYRTRLFTALSWVFLTSLHTRNLYVTDGGDDLVRYLVFLSIFADLGGCWSLDVALGRRSQQPVPVLGLRFLQLHIALLYFCAARLKFRKGWLTHNVVFQCLQLTGFVRPPGHFLRSFPELCRASTLMTLACEFAFAFLALSPLRVGPCRALAFAAGVGVQLGILLMMRVGVFTESMLAAMALFVRPKWFDWATRRLGHSTPAETEGDATATLFWSRELGANARSVTLAFLAFNFVSLAWGPFAARRLPLPHWAVAERQWLWLDQPFGLFDVVYDIPRWQAAGIDSVGAHVDVLAVAVPDLVPRVRWRFSRWYKFTFKERERAFHFPELGAYICRAYRENSGHQLREFTLVEGLTPPTEPGGPEPASRRRERWHQTCEQPAGTN